MGRRDAARQPIGAVLEKGAGDQGPVSSESANARIASSRGRST